MATVALEEGLPLSWVPRTEVVVLLIEADGPETRVDILTDHRDDILDDFEKAVSPIEHEWAVQCRAAVAAMRAGLDGPAQSHASNIVDGIVLGLHGKNGREHAKKRAREDFDDLPLQLAAENLSLRPLCRALPDPLPIGPHLSTVFTARVGALSGAAQMALLLAAAEQMADPLLLRRAAGTMAGPRGIRPRRKPKQAGW